MRDGVMEDGMEWDLYLYLSLNLYLFVKKEQILRDGVMEGSMEWDRRAYCRNSKSTHEFAREALSKPKESCFGCIKYLYEFCRESMISAVLHASLMPFLYQIFVRVLSRDLYQVFV